MGAPIGNKNAEGNPGGGRPSLYESRYAEMGRKLAMLGCTDKEMADVLGIGETTLYAWKHEHVEFAEALKKGKDLADGEVVAKLYERALGYSHEDVHITTCGGEVVQTPIIKYYPPDPTSAIFWLKNRRPAQWREKVELTGAGGKDLIPQVDDRELARRVAFVLNGALAKGEQDA